MKALGCQKIDSDTHYIVLTNWGFRLHSIAGNGALIRDCEEIEGGLSLCQSYRNTQLFFVVGTGENGAWPTSKLFIWDNELKKKLAELEFKDSIVDLRVVGDWVVVAQKDRVVPLKFDVDLCQV